jgi:hypothetical protein
MIQPQDSFLTRFLIRFGWWGFFIFFVGIPLCIFLLVLNFMFRLYGYAEGLPKSAINWDNQPRKTFWIHSSNIKSSANITSAVAYFIQNDSDTLLYPAFKLNSFSFDHINGCCGLINYRFKVDISKNLSSEPRPATKFIIALKDDARQTIIWADTCEFR